MQKQILKYSFITLSLALAFLSWLSVDRAVNNPGSSDWLIPMLWLFLFFATICLDAVIIKKTYIEKALLAVSFLLGFIFVHNGWHILAVLFGLLFVFLAFEKINKDLELNIRIDLWKTLRTGRAMIMLGLAIVISSQYYFQAKDIGLTNMIPEFKSESLFGSLTTKILSKVNPQFSKLEDEGLTIDEMIMEVQGEKVNANVSIELNKELDKKSKELMLGEARKQLSETAGFEIKGDERVSDVLSASVNNKINDYFRPLLADSQYSTIMPMVMAIIVFLTIISLGSILSPLAVAVAVFIFWIFIKLELISIKKVPAEKEVIE